MRPLDPDCPADKNESATSPAELLDATGVFQKPSQEPRKSPSAEEVVKPSGTSAPSPPETALFAAPKLRPTVHEVKFHVPGTGDPSLEDPLQRLLQASPPQRQGPSAPGAFTQLFNALSPAPVPTPAPPEFTPPPQAQAPIDTPTTHPEPSQGQPLTSMSDTAHYSAVLKTAALPQGPGRPAEDVGFTQLFQAIQGPTSKAAQAASNKPTPAMEDGRKEAAVQAGPTETGPVVPSLAQTVSEPGSFTQIFGKAAPPQELETTSFEAPDSKPPDAHGSFTRLFAALHSAGQSGPSQADQFPPLPAARATPYRSPESAVSPLRAGNPSPFGAQPPSSSEPKLGAVEPFSPASDSLPTSGSGGGLTRLLRALENPPSLPASAPAETFGGSAFGSSQPSTSTPLEYNEQDRIPFSQDPPAFRPSPTVAFRLPEPAQRPSPPPRPTFGPGEYTRIIQASALRESGLASGGAPAPPVPTGVPVAPNPAVSTPQSRVASPLPPWTMPPVPQMPHLNSAGGAMVPAPLPPIPQMPAFQMPAVAPPSMPTPAAGGKPSLLPILLIAIIVVLVGVLVAVLLLRH